MFLRSRRRWLLGAALFAAGCLSPTLPLPPPTNPEMTATDTQGLVQLSGSVPPQSEVFALNHNTNQIAGQYTESGAYKFTIAAQEHDSMSLWYVHATEESPPADFFIKLPTTP